MSVEALEPAFRATRYRVETPAGNFDLRVGLHNPAFDEWLRRQGASRWGIVTPCNPGAVRLTEERNRARRIAFLSRIEALGYPCFNACNLADTGDWPPEAGCLLLQVDAETLRDLAVEFGQLALVAGEAGSAPRLVWV